MARRRADSSAMRMRWWLAFACASAALVTAPAQEGVLRPGATLYSVIGAHPSDNFGKDFAVVGDTDGDGVNDFAVNGVGQVRDFEAATFRAGRIDLISGRDGSRLREWHGPRRNDVFGRELDALPDIDGDGVYELGAFNRSGFLTVLSPVTGTTWFTIPRHQERGGNAIAQRVADRDGDGVEEFVLVDVFELLRTNDHDPCLYPSENCVWGRVRLHSGRTGEVFWEYMGSPPEGSLSPVVVPAGDFNSDGVEDLLLRQWPPEDHPRPSVLFLLSGADGTLLDTLDHADGRADWGFNLVSLGDHDGNGYPELAVAAPLWDTPENADGQRGWVGVYHLPDFHLTWSVRGRHPVFTRGPDSGDLLGSRMANVGDVDGDGADDLLIGTIRASIERLRFGRLYLHSGRSGELLMSFEGLHAVFQDSFGGSDSDYFDKLAPLDDLDGDGRAEFLVGHWNADAHGDRLSVGEVRVVRYQPGTTRFLRADTNGDGRINIADIVALVRGIYTREPLACAMAHDQDGDGLRTPNDVLRLLFWYFFPDRNEEPPPPYPECGYYDVLHSYFDLGCEDEGSCATR